MLTSDIENFPGYPEGIEGPHMMKDLRKQLSIMTIKIINMALTHTYGGKILLSHSLSYIFLFFISIDRQ